LTKTKNQKNKL